MDVPGAEIVDEKSFHDVFARTFQFADYYGRSMNAWIDLMTYLDLDGQVDAIAAPPGALVIIQLRDAQAFLRRSPELYQAMVDGVTFVNYRRLEAGEPALLALLPA
ncbi:MAG: barstar family protein [Caulobacteraceae bacterium]